MMRLLSVLIPFLMLTLHSGKIPASDPIESWVIQDVGIVEVRSGTVNPGQHVLIKGNRIASIGTGEEIAIPTGAGIIDGSGKYLMPGLWDAHIHTSGDAETRYAILPLLIANGITGARSMAADCHFENGECSESMGDVDQWRRDIETGKMAGPRLAASSYYTDGPDSPGESSIENPGTDEHARAYARLLNDRGVDLIKVYSGMNREAYFAMADEALALGLEFGGHVPLTVQTTEASNAGQSTIEHITGFLEECSSLEETLRPKLSAAYDTPVEFWSILIELAETMDDRKCGKVYEVLARNGTWHVPTLSTEAFFDGLESPRGEWRNDPNMKYVPRIEVKLWENLEKSYFEGMDNHHKVLQPHYRGAFEITRDSHRAGVPMMAGSDAGEHGIIWGFSLHQELQYLVQAGLSEADALRAATINPARYRGMEQLLGTIEAGKLADLILVNANPLEDISNTASIDTVIANGRVFRRSDLNALLRDVEDYVKSTWSEAAED